MLSMSNVKNTLRKILILSKKTIIFSIKEVNNTFTTNPFEEGKKTRKVIVLIALLFVSYLLSGVIFNLRIQILFFLPIILGIVLSYYTYKETKALLKYGSDFALFTVATITSAYLVINTTTEKVDFFNHYMQNGIGFFITNIFSVAASIRCYISFMEFKRIYRKFIE